MEELNVLKELFKELANENVKFDVTYIDSDGHKERLEIGNNDQHNDKDCCDENKDTAEDLHKIIDIKNKYIEQLVARLDKDNKEKIERQKHITESRLSYLELCKRMTDCLSMYVMTFKALIKQLDFENEEFYTRFCDIMESLFVQE